MAFLRGFGSWVPDRVVTNAELAARLGCDAAWITAGCGIEERRYAGAGDSVASMGARAAEDCLARCSAEASSIGLLIATGGTGERRFPGPAAEIAHRLGIAPAPAIDLPIASAGAVFGLALASELAAAYGSVLVVAAEKMSAAVAAGTDRNTAILFGDGAGAALVDAHAGAAAVRASVLHSDGAFAGDLRLELQGDVQMNGPAVILQSSRKIPGVIREALAKAGTTADEAGVFLMHQANRNLILRVAKALDVPAGKFFCNIERYGNTSSASVLIAAAEWERARGFRPGEGVVFAGFGAGFHWGALVARGV